MPILGYRSLFIALCAKAQTFQGIHIFACWTALHLVTFTAKYNEHNYFAFSISTLQEGLSQVNIWIANSLSNARKETVLSSYDSTVLLSCNFIVAWLFFHAYKSHNYVSQQ